MCIDPRTSTERTFGPESARDYPLTDAAATGAFLLGGVAAACVISFAVRMRSPLLLLVIPAAALVGALANVAAVLWARRSSPRPPAMPSYLVRVKRSGAALSVKN